ncbi:MAG: zinc ABC transporter substrate-binding protein [Actinomycetota bacterium]|nr:zinc ABC transporter substrate-binding protein [Actinomycetota bacterium]
MTGRRTRISSLPVVLVALAAGCGGGSARASSGASSATQRVRVAAQPFALAEVARRVGLDRVVVADQGDVVLTTGGDPDPWLDPVAMEAVTAAVAVTLSAADPGGRNAYQAAARAFQAQLGALDINFRSSLADCARHDVVAADKALARTGTRYNFVVHGATEAGIAAMVARKGIPVVFTEPDVARQPVLALAQATHTRVDELDTLTRVASAPSARAATYLALMADNLAKLRTALACTSASAS